jgi:prolyl-tRNA synthetase
MEMEQYKLKKVLKLGHIFKLGKLYAESMKANVLNAEAKLQHYIWVVMVLVYQDWLQPQ